MKVVIPISQTRVLIRRIIAAGEHALLAVSPFAFGQILHPFLGWNVVAAFCGFLGLLAFLITTGRWCGIELSWDHEGLTYATEEGPSHISWNEFAGYQRTWDLPRTLRVFRTSGKPFIVDTFVLESDQRAMLLAELSAHSERALPNKRLKLTAPS